MNRSEMREQAFILLYEKEFFEELPCSSVEEVFSENIAELSDYGRNAFENTYLHKDELDSVISKYLNGWKLQRISKVDLAILRLAIYEIDYVESVPANVAVNEAVELAKKYSGDGNFAFINGILGSYLRDK